MAFNTAQALPWQSYHKVSKAHANVDENDEALEKDTGEAGEFHFS